MYSIKETKNPPIVKPLKMTCDDPLHPNIPHPLPNRGGARFLIVGTPGSGKTNWAVSQLIKGGAYHHVFDSKFACGDAIEFSGELRKRSIRKPQ